MVFSMNYIALIIILGYLNHRMKHVCLVCNKSAHEMKPFNFKGSRGGKSIVLETLDTARSKLITAFRGCIFSFLQKKKLQKAF